MTLRFSLTFESKLKHHLAERLIKASVPAVATAQELCRKDTGDLSRSIRTEGPYIDGKEVSIAIVAGGTVGQVRGEIIDYAIDIEAMDPYLRPAGEQLIREIKGQG